MSFHAFLTRLIWLCMAPLLLLAAYLAIANIHDRQAERDLEAANLAKSFATMIDQHLNARISALHMLAESSLVDDASRWKDLYREAQGFHQGFGCHVILADLNMRMLFNTRVPFGAELPLLPRPKGHSAVSAVLETGRPAVGDSFFGPIAKESLVAIAVPAMREGKIAFLLLTIFETRQFQALLDQVALPEGWAHTLLDGKQDALACRTPPGMDAANDVDAAGRFEVKSSASPWSVRLEIPRNVYRQPLIHSSLILVAVLLGVILVSLLGGHWFGRRLARVVASLADVSPPVALKPVITEIEAARTLLDEAAAAKKLSEKEVRKSEARYRSLFEAANVGKSVTLPTGEIEVNRAFGDMLGYGPEELRGKTWQELTPADEIGPVNELLAPLLRGERDAARFEKRYIHKNGSLVWADVSATLQRDRDGNPLHFITTVVDITERRRAEKQLAEQLHELQRWHDVMLDREDRVIDLKREVNELLARGEEPLRYPSAVAGDLNGMSGDSPPLKAEEE